MPKIVLKFLRVLICWLCSMWLTGCSPQLPPAPTAAPAYGRYLTAPEYDRPCWSPDGKELFFHGGPPEHYRLYRLPRDGGEPVDFLGELHRGNPAVSWTAKKLAYNVRTADGSLEIWTANLDGSARHRVTHAGIDVLPAWSPNGIELSYIFLPEGRLDIVPAQGGRARALGKSFSKATWAPDGKHLVMLQGDVANGNIALMLVSLPDGSHRVLQCTVATNLPGNLWSELETDWSPDGRWIVWPTLTEGRMQLVLIDVAADKLVQRLDTVGSATHPSFSPDGKWIAYASESAGKLRGIRTVSVDGMQDKAATRPEEFVAAALIHYTSAGGLQIPAFLFRQPAVGQKKRPAVVWLHGGGAAGATLDAFDRNIQYLAGNGFVVLAPNYRPSRGFGPELITARQGKDIADDVAAGAAYLKALPEVDRERVFALGASFGGYAVLRTVTAYPSTFRAAANLSGPCDLAALYHEVPQQRALLNLLLGGSPEAQPERYRQESPINQVDRIRTPLITIHGTADHTIPYHQARLLTDAMQKAGKPHKLVTYRGIDHGFSPAAWANATKQALSFFNEQQ